MAKRIPRWVIATASFLLFSLFYIIILAVDITSGGIQAFYLLAASPLMLVIYCALCGLFLYRHDGRIFITSLLIALGYTVFLIGSSIYNALAYESGEGDIYFLILHVFYLLIIFSVTPFFSRLAKRHREQREAMEKAGIRRGR